MHTFHFQLDLEIASVSRIVLKKNNINCYFFSKTKGQRFASLEEKVILSTLFRHFSFHATQTIDELHLASDSILRPHVPIKMSIRRRNHQ